MIRVISLDNKNKKKWVADFAQRPTAETFIRKQNQIYKGHLTFVEERGNENVV